MARHPDSFFPTHLRADRERRAKERQADKARGDAEYDRTKRYADPKLARAARIRNSKAWKQLRDWYIRHHPLCEDPLGRHGVRPAPASQVHHIEGVAEHPELAFNRDNLMSLCSGCHAAVEARARARKRQEVRR